MKLFIAREKNGFIGLYKQKPIWVRINRFREDWDGDFMGLFDNDSFPEVTFENSPQEVELILCNRRIDTINIQDCDPKKQPCLLTNHGIETNVIFK